MKINRVENHNITYNKQLSFKSSKAKDAAYLTKMLMEYGGGMAALVGLSQVNFVNAKKNKEYVPETGYLPKSLSKEEINQADSIFNILKLETQNIEIEEIEQILFKAQELPAAKVLAFMNAIRDFKTNNYPPKYEDALYFLQYEPIKDFMRVALLNTAIIDLEEGQTYSRFSIVDMADLAQWYYVAEDKKFMQDLISDCATNLYYEDAKLYRFDKEEIISLLELFHETKYKQLLMQVLAKQEPIPNQNSKLREFNTEQIIDLVAGCVDDDEAEFLSNVLTKFRKDSYGNKVESFSGEDIYVLRSLYRNYPFEILSLVDSEYEFNIEEIKSILKCSISVGDDVLNIIKENPSIDKASLFMMLNSLETSNKKAKENNHLKKVTKNLS